MREVAMCDGRVVIIDDVLDPASLDAMLIDLDRTPLDSIDHRAAPIWDHRGNANPSVGERLVWCERSFALPAPLAARPKGSAAADVFDAIGFRRYPTGRAIDRILEVAVDAGRRHGLIPGTSADPFAGAVATVYSYAAGHRLRWHCDGDYLGAFAAYLSPHWSENDGGHLAVEDDQEQTAIGVARIIAPRLNRLVLLGPRIRHAVLSVANDVEHPRVSVSGFFVKRSEVAAMIATGLGKLLRCVDAKQPTREASA